GGGGGGCGGRGGGDHGWGWRWGHQPRGTDSPASKEEVKSADPPALAGGRVAGRVHADPALVDRLAGALVTGVARDAQLVGRAVVEGGVDEEHAEGDEIAGLELGRQAAAAELVADDGRVVGERAAEGPLAGFRGLGL